MSPAMRTTVLSAALALLAAVVLVALAGPAHAAGSAEVKFVEPQRFSDAGRTGAERDHTLDVLSAHLRSLAKRLPDGQVLRVEVLDVNLAGELHPTRTTDVRVLRGTVDGPHVHLRWTLAEGERALRSGDERLSDLGYMQQLRLAPGTSGELPYETRMLTRWFEGQFAKAR